MEHKKDQISICVFFGVVPDALRPQQRPANIMYSFLLSSGKKGGEMAWKNETVPNTTRKA